jgi:transposase, IS5 family
MVGARSFPGNPYDGHTLEQTCTLLEDIGTKPMTAVVDLGYRGVDHDIAPVQLVHRGKFKSLDAQQRRWLKRRQVIELAIRHAKLDHHMDRCWLQGAQGDALHAVLCAAGFNIRWLRRAIARKRLASLLLTLSEWASHRRGIVPTGYAVRSIAPRAVGRRLQITCRPMAAVSPNEIN